MGYARLQTEVRPRCATVPARVARASPPHARSRLAGTPRPADRHRTSRRPRGLLIRIMLVGAALAPRSSLRARRHRAHWHVAPCCTAPRSTAPPDSALCSSCGPPCSACSGPLASLCPANPHMWCCARTHVDRTHARVLFVDQIPQSGSRIPLRPEGPALALCQRSEAGTSGGINGDSS